MSHTGVIKPGSDVQTSNIPSHVPTTNTNHNFHVSPWLQKMSTSIAATIHSVAAPQAVDRANMMAKALKHGSKPWRRGKLSIVGEGRAGKSALANSFIGRPFEQTASTVGINQLTCNVKHIQATTDGKAAKPEDGLRWGETQKAERELESALAEIIARNKRQEGRKSFDKVAGAGSGNGGSIVNYINDKRTAYVELNERRKEYTELMESGEEHVLDIKLNEELVMKALATIDDDKSGLLISLFDFGGQSVFDVIHHLFLTRNGVYALVFNMEWLVTDGPERSKALSFLRNWFSSIAVHTYDFESHLTAPIVLVGTRLDLVSDPHAHQDISTLLYEQFSNHPAWRSVLQNSDGRDGNGKAQHCFFPIDNVCGGRSEAVQRVMDAAHGAMLSAAYTQKEVPLSWFAVIDRMNDAQKNCLALAEVVAIGGSCGVSPPEIPLLLSFLHDMGHLMWIDEPGLRDVVVLDPISYLVAPATVIICNLSPDQKEATHHLQAPHRECERLHKKEWTKLKQSGVLSACLLPILWKDYAAHTDQLLRLMTKFGLLVPLRGSSKKPGADNTAIELYLVPALQTPVSETALGAAAWTDDAYESVYFVFTISDELALSSTITSDDLRTFGFMPGAMFGLILAKALSWSHATAVGTHIDLKNVLLCKDVAVLAFGGQWFRLMHCVDLHCLRVDIVGANPIGVQQKILDFIHEITLVLPCFPAVLYAAKSDKELPSVVDPLKRALLPSELLIPLEQLRRAARGESMLAWKFGRTLLSTRQVQAQYGPWLQIFDLREQYDVFISYRWGAYDSEFTATLFDMLTNFSVGADQRAVEVFLDRKRLRDGRQFKADFAAALSHSLIAVPVVSVDALARMLTHTGAEVDNVLLEWIIIHECFVAGRLLKVFPVLFGARSVVDVITGEVVVQDFFQSGAVALLPTMAPTATLTKAAELLISNNIPLSSKFSSYTVHSVVDDLLQFLLFKVPERPGALLVETFAVKLVSLLGECGEDALAAIAPAVVAPAPSVVAIMSAPVQGPVYAAPEHTGRHPADLSVPEVCALLEHLHLPKLALIIAQNKVSGMMLSFCETEQDLQTAEYGIPSDVLARGLLKLIKRWVLNGVPVL